MKTVFLIVANIAAAILVTKHFVIPTLTYIIKDIRTRIRGKYVIAEIVGYDRQKDMDGIMFIFPIVRFTTDEGRIVEKQIDFGRPEREKYHEEFIGVYYDPKQPHEFISKSFERLIVSFVAITISFGALSIVMVYTYSQI